MLTKLRLRLAGLVFKLGAERKKTYLLYVASQIAYGFSKDTVRLLLVNEDSQVWFP